MKFTWVIRTLKSFFGRLFFILMCQFFDGDVSSPKLKMSFYPPHVKFVQLHNFQIYTLTEIYMIKNVVNDKYKNHEYEIYLLSD